MAKSNAGDPGHDRSDLLRRGYARITDPDAAAAGRVPAFAIDWALKKLGSKNPAPPAQQPPVRGRGRPLCRCLTKPRSTRQEHHVVVGNPQAT
jgi:hypothetical protein